MTTNSNTNLTMATTMEVIPQLVFATVAEARQAVQEASHPFSKENVNTHTTIILPSGEVYSLVKEEFLSVLNLNELKGYCRANGISGFGSFRKESDKANLIDFIVSLQDEVVQAAYNEDVDLDEALAASYDIEEGKRDIRSINDLRKYVSKLHKENGIKGVFTAFAEIAEYLASSKEKMVKSNQQNASKLVELNNSLNLAYKELKASLETFKLPEGRANDKLKFQAQAQCKALRKKVDTIKEDIDAIKALGCIEVSLANTLNDVALNVGGSFSNYAISLAKHVLETADIAENATTEENYKPVITAEVVIGLDTAEIVKNEEGKAVVKANFVRNLLTNPTLYTTKIAESVAHLTEEVPYVRVPEVVNVENTILGEDEEVEQDMYVKRLPLNDLNDVKFQKALDLTGYVTSVKFEEPPMLDDNEGDIEKFELMRKLAIIDGVLLDVGIEDEQLMHVKHLNMSASESRQGRTGHGYLGDLSIAEFSRSLEFYLLETGKRDEKNQTLKVNADKIPGRLGGSYKSDGQLLLNASDAYLSNMTHERVTNNLSVISNEHISIAITESLETVIDKGRFAVTDKDNGGVETIIDLEKENREISLSVADGMSYVDADTLYKIMVAEGVKNPKSYLRTHTFRITGGAILRGMMIVVKGLKKQIGHDFVTTEDSSKVKILEGKSFNMTYVRVLENKATQKEDFRKVSSQVLVNTSRAVQKVLVDINRETIDQYKEDILASKPTELTRTNTLLHADELTVNQADLVLHSVASELLTVVPQAVEEDARLLSVAYNASDDYRKAFLTGKTLINQTFRFIAHDPGLALYIIMNNLKAANKAIAKGSKDDVAEGAIFKFRQEDEIVKSYGEALKENEVFVQNPNRGEFILDEKGNPIKDESTGKNKIDKKVAFDGLVMGIKYPYIDSRQTVLAQGVDSVVYTNAIKHRTTSKLGKLVMNVEGLAIFSAFSADIPGASNADFDGDKMAIILDERITKAYYDALGNYSNYSEKLVDYYTTEENGVKVLKSGIPWSSTQKVKIDLPEYASVDPSDTSEVIIDLSMLDEATRFDFSVEPAEGKYSYKEVENFVYAYRDAIAVRTLKPAEVGLVNDEMSYINEVITHYENALENSNLDETRYNFIKDNLPSLKLIGRTLPHYIQYVIDSSKHSGEFRSKMTLIQNYLLEGHPLIFLVTGFNEATGAPIYATRKLGNGDAETKIKLRSLLFRPKHEGRSGYFVLNTPLKTNRDYAVKALVEIEEAFKDRLMNANTRTNMLESLGINQEVINAELGGSVSSALTRDVKAIAAFKSVLDMSIGANFGKSVTELAQMVRNNTEDGDKYLPSMISLKSAIRLLENDFAEAKSQSAKMSSYRGVNHAEAVSFMENLFDQELDAIKDALFLENEDNLTAHEVSQLDSAVRKSIKNIFATIASFAQSELLALAKTYEHTLSKDIAYQAIILFAINEGINDEKLAKNKARFSEKADEIANANSRSKTQYIDMPINLLYSGTSFFYTCAAPLVIDLYGNESQREAILGKYYKAANRQAEESVVELPQNGPKTTSALVLLQDVQKGLITDQATVQAVHYVSQELDKAKANNSKLNLNFYVEKALISGQPHFTMKLVSHKTGAVVSFGVISKGHAAKLNHTLSSIVPDYEKFSYFHIKSAAIANRFANDAIAADKQHFVDLSEVKVSSVLDFNQEVKNIVALGKQVR